MRAAIGGHGEDVEAGKQQGLDSVESFVIRIRLRLSCVPSGPAGLELLRRASYTAELRGCQLVDYGLMVKAPVLFGTPTVVTVILVSLAIGDGFVVVRGTLYSPVLWGGMTT